MPNHHHPHTHTPSPALIRSQHGWVSVGVCVWGGSTRLTCEQQLSKRVCLSCGIHARTRNSGGRGGVIRIELENTRKVNPRKSERRGPVEKMQWRPKQPTEREGGRGKTRNEQVAELRLLLPPPHHLPWDEWERSTLGVINRFNGLILCHITSAQLHYASF